MMQKFGFGGTRRRSPQALPHSSSAHSRLADAYGETMESAEKLKMEQKRAYYYQVVPSGSLDKTDEQSTGAVTKFGFRPRRTCSENVALNTFVETMAFSRDSCSDTDSGICTDNGSECQQSPKCSSPSSSDCANSDASSGLRPATIGRGRQPAIAVLPPPSNFKLRHASASSPVTQDPQSLYSRRNKQPMKVRFADEVATETALQQLHNGRKALPQIPARHDPHKSFCEPPSATCHPHPPAPPSSAIPQKVPIIIPRRSKPAPSNSSGHYYSLPPPISNCTTQRASRRDSPPPLPDYEMAMRRMRQIGGHKGRSVSLPRRPDQSQRRGSDQTEGLRIYDNSQLEDWDDDDEAFLPADHSFTLPRSVGAGTDKRLSEAKSLENLAQALPTTSRLQEALNNFISSNRKSVSPSKSCEDLQQAGCPRTENFLSASPSNAVSLQQSSSGDFGCRNQRAQIRNRPRFQHCMSTELQKIADNALQKTGAHSGQKTSEVSKTTIPQKSNQHQKFLNPAPLIKSLTLNRPAQNNYHVMHVNSFPSSEAELSKYHNEGEPLITDRLIETRLLGLDHQGIQLIELRKRDDGPFGFYIATGSFKKKKGIFISRITIRGLFPLLSVGDQILDVDFQPVKGRSLEEVQQMMANTDRVILRTLPAIMR